MLPRSEKDELEEIHSLPATSFECCKLVLKVISATDYSCNFCIVTKRTFLLLLLNDAYT